MDVRTRRIESQLSGKLHELCELNRKLDMQASTLDDIADTEDPVEDRVKATENEASELLDQLGEAIAYYTTRNETGNGEGNHRTTGDNGDRESMQYGDKNTRQTNQTKALSESQKILVQGLQLVHKRETVELRRLSTMLHHKIDNARLVASVWKNNTGKASDVDHLLRERTSIQSASGLVDNAIEQASEARRALDAQKKMLMRGSSRLSQLLGIFPKANTFINKLRSKKNRDRLILAAVIALCTLFCVWWVIG